MKKKQIKKKLWIIVDKDNGEILQVELNKKELNIWDDGKKVLAEISFKI